MYLTSADQICLCMKTRSQTNSFNMADFQRIEEILKDVKAELEKKASNEKIDLLLAEIHDKENRILNLERHVEELQSKVSILENISSLLERKCDDNEQYSRRVSLRINNIPVSEEKETGNDCLNKVKEIVQMIPDLTISDYQFDRAHRVGKAKTKSDGTVSRQMIVRLNSWTARSLVYKNRKTLGNYRVYMDLTKRRFDLKNLAIERVKDNNKVSFVMADINCSLCLRLVTGRFRYFNSKIELDSILDSI